MSMLKDILAQKIPAIRKDIKQLLEDHGSKVISEVTVAQAYGGMRGVKCMVCDTSVVDPDLGVSIRGRPISTLADRLPEEILFLLLTGELPNDEALSELQNDLRIRAEIPPYAWKVLYELPADAHPMDMFNTVILALERESEFRRRYSEGMSKEDYWIPALEGSLQLIAKVPALAAGVYRIRFGKGEPLLSDPSLDWAGNFAHLFGFPDPQGEFANLMRLYMTLHCDHEAGNVSANTCHIVGSSLADPYYAVAAGLNGLAGPLHGLASQECLNFIMGVRDEFGGVPKKEELQNYVWKLLKSGRVVPGYGHAVLRATDPRFSALHAFGKRACSGDTLFGIVDLGFEAIPEVLKQHGKAKNPYPNVDAVSGSLLHHFGIEEKEFYTVVFGVSRVLGMLSQYIINRAMGTPITRPKSVPTEWIKAHVGAKG